MKANTMTPTSDILPALENDTFTQFGYACKHLGVDLKTTSVPQAKGCVERLFGILQSRLPIELKLTGIKNTEQANEFLASYLKKNQCTICSWYGLHQISL